MEDDRYILLYNIKKKRRLSVMSLFGILGAMMFGGFFVLFVFAKQWIPAIVLFCLFLFCAGFLICINKIMKHMRKEPYKIRIEQEMTYDNILTRLSALSKVDGIAKISDKQIYFKIRKQFNYRILLTQVENFDKKKYDSLRRNANKKYNAQFHPKQWVSRADAHKMMRINLICSLEMNRELQEYISRNSAHLLRRVEGIVNFVVCDHMISIPPLYGNVNFAEVDRYAKCIKFILGLLRVS